DVLTVVEHELGHALGLADSEVVGDVMDHDLDIGVRRLARAEDAANSEKQTEQGIVAGTALASELALPVSAAAQTSTIVAGTFGDDILHINAGGVVVAGGGGADAFVIDQLPSAAPAHIADYSALQNDIIDVSAIVTLPPVMPGQPAPTDADLVRVAEDASGTFATLQVSSAGHWT